MSHTTSFRETLKTQSKEVDLELLSKSQRTGRVMTFSAVEKVLVEALENILLRGRDDPSLTEGMLRQEAREELSRLLAAHRGSAAVASGA